MSERCQITVKKNTPDILSLLKHYVYFTQTILFSFVISMTTLLIPSNQANAEAIGMPLIPTPHIGYSVGVAILDINDPDGSTDNFGIFQPLEIVYTDKITGGFPYRYWFELHYQEGTVHASVNDIGQFIQQYGLRATMQRIILRNPSWHYWIGAGFDLANTQYKDRHLVDSDGFLVAQFSDRKETGMGVLINFSADTKLARNVILSTKIEQQFSFNKGIDIFSISTTFLYRL